MGNNYAFKILWDKKIALVLYNTFHGQTNCQEKNRISNSSNKTQFLNWMKLVK